MTPRKSVRHMGKTSTPRPGRTLTQQERASPPQPGVLPASITATPRRSLRLMEKAYNSRPVAVTPPGTGTTASSGRKAVETPGSIGEAPSGSGAAGSSGDAVCLWDVRTPPEDVGTASLRGVSHAPGARGRIARRPRGRPKGPPRMAESGPRRPRGRPRSGTHVVIPDLEPLQQKSVFKRTLDFLKIVLPLVIPTLLVLPVSYIFEK